MKTGATNRDGSILVTMLMITALLGISLLTYLDLVRDQNLSTMRSQQWNASIPVLEAGVEEALTHIYHTYKADLGVDGWSLVDGVYRKERVLGENKYVVSIKMGTEPSIVAQAYMRAPLKGGYLNPPRTVQVVVTNAPIFAKGMVAKGQIDLSGNNIRTDSFNSADPDHSTGGIYDPVKAKDNGDVATNSSVIDTLNVWNAQIYGKASTGPGGNVRLGANGAVGSAEWHAAGNSGIEPGWSTDDMNVHFPDVKAPFSGGALTPAGGTVDGVNYTYVLTSGNWELSSLSLSGQQKVLVAGDAVLYITGDISLTGESSINIASSSSLELYAAGVSTAIGGNGVLNEAGNALDFTYYGLPSNTSLKMSGNAAFVGSVYAPQAVFTMGGGGSDTYDFVGASVTDSVKMNGHFNFHYDENLASDGPRRGYVVESWDEIFGQSSWSYSEL